MRGKHNESCTSFLVTIRRFTMMLLTKWYIIIWGKLANAILIQLQILKSRNLWTRKFYCYYFLRNILSSKQTFSKKRVISFLSFMLPYIVWRTGPLFRESSNRTQDTTVVERENRTDKKYPVFESLGHSGLLPTVPRARSKRFSGSCLLEGLHTGEDFSYKPCFWPKLC